VCFRDGLPCGKEYEITGHLEVVAVEDALGPIRAITFGASDRELAQEDRQPGGQLIW
jgi:hypothetical protein